MARNSDKGGKGGKQDSSDECNPSNVFIINEIMIPAGSRVGIYDMLLYYKGVTPTGVITQ